MLYCISVNYKNVGADIRSRFAFDIPGRQKLRESLAEAGFSESVILCTCNRSEIYFIGSESSDAVTVMKIMCRGDIVPGSYFRVFRDKQAVRHLFRVCCGIDSMILGEDEILGQTRSAYYESLESGFSGYELNTIFQAAVTCAKKIKTETELSVSSVSAATLAANEAALFAEKVNVLVIGSSGKIGSSVLKNLTAHKNVNVSRTVRSHSGVEYIPTITVTDIPYSERYEHIGEFDCIISATSSPHFTVTAAELIKRKPENKKMLLIDLAVPPDIEKSAAEINGVTLIGIDLFRKLAEKNNLLKQKAADTAENMISEETDKLYKKMLFHDFLPNKENVRKKLENISFDEIIFELRDSLTCSEFESVLKAIERM